MKKSILVLFVLCMSLKTYSNGVNPKTILVSNKWKLDIEKTIGLNTKDKEENKSIALKKLIKDLNFTFEFTQDDKMTLKMHELDVYKGTYNIKKQNGKDFLTQEIRNEKFVYEIISIQKERIVFRPLNEKDNVILIPSEKSTTDLETILIANEWKMDSEYIENLLSKFESSSEIQGLTDEEKDASILGLTMTFQGVRYKFMKDSKFEMKLSAMGVERYRDPGTFVINKEKNEITIDTEMEPNQVYKIISVNKDKIHLKHIQRDNDLILVPSR